MAVAEVAAEQQRQRDWSQATEFLAAAVELLQHIAGRLDAGIATAWVKRVPSVPASPPIARPEWVAKPAQGDEPTKARGNEVVMTPAEFFRSQTRRG